MKYALYTTKSGSKYLVSKDGKLKAKNRTRFLENLVIGRIEDSKGRYKDIKNYLKIPKGLSFIFMSGDEIEGSESAQIHLLTTSLIVKPPEILTEAQVQNYLQH